MSSCSGQVMVEVCLAMALLVFAWIAVTFATYMSTNHIRTAMAARHAAWIKGNGEEPAVELIESNFFFQSGVTKVETGEGMGIADLVAGSADCAAFGDAKRGPYVAKVTFGILPEDINATTAFPFTLMKVQVPLMPLSLMEEFLSVESQCQWDDVGDTWTDRKKALKDSLGTFKAEMKGVLGKWSPL